MGILSKVFNTVTAPKEEPISSAYPIEVMSWSEMYDDMSRLVSVLQKDEELTGIKENV